MRERWEKLPKGYSFTQVPGMGVDSKDRIYVFNRNPNHVFVLERDGTFVNMWGEEFFADCAKHSPHGFYIDRDDKAYTTDTKDHTVRKWTLEGELLLTLGTEGTPGKYGEPFNRPAEAAISSSGDIFVADGYGNTRVHKFSPDGNLLLSWGTSGNGPGQFNLPHGIWVDKEDRVWVADRANNRIQIFTTEGEYITQFTGFKWPSSFFIDTDDIVYVPECLGRMSILNINGIIMARWGGEKCRILDYVSKVSGDFISYQRFILECLREPGKISIPHSCCVDSNGDLYIGEGKNGQRVTKFIRKT